MRFNDLFATVLSGPTESPWSRAILWRQCVDLLAQYGRGADADSLDLDRVAQTLTDLRGQVPAGQKVAALRELGARLTSSRLVRLMLDEEPTVAVAATGVARLPDHEWPAIVAEAGPLARSILRQRADLGPETRRALDAFGLADLSLIDLNADQRDVPAPVIANAPEQEQEQSQIRRIVDRIERFTNERQERLHRGPAQAAAAEEAFDGASFTFVTDADGVIQSAPEGPRASLVGLRLATPSLDRTTGPDGQILGAFRRRGAFRDGRFTIGEGALAGCWLVDSDPLFDQRTGRFTGYRGRARRANELDLAPYVANGDAGQGEATERAASLRQLIHELRTPLSGVMGFAELIEAQLLGPVSDGYRTMAGDIISDVHQLVDILDDIDLANRMDRLRAPAGETGGDAARFLVEAVERVSRDAQTHRTIAIDGALDLSPVDVAPPIAERMIVHFVRALSGCVGTETLRASARQEGDRVVIEIDRPIAMAALSERQLFDSAFEHVAGNLAAPVLGVGFALRLVRRLAEANRGSLVVHADSFALRLPASDRPAEREALS